MPAGAEKPNGAAIRAVILDYGEVITHPPNPAVLADMATELGVATERFRELYGTHRYAYDRGDLSGEDYWAAVARGAGAELTPEQIARLRATDVQIWSDVNPAMLIWAEELRAAGIRTAVLSNMHPDMVEFARRSFAWLKAFDCHTLSSELRMAKPDAAIFQHSLDCLGVKPAEAIFVDDREPNVRAAQEIGIVGICANSSAKLRDALHAMQWPGPLPS